MAKETMKEKMARLERENSALRAQIDLLYEKLNALHEAQDDGFLASPAYQQYRSENEVLKQRTEALERSLANADEKNAKLIDQLMERPEKAHNERGAGRKPHGAKWQKSYAKFVELQKCHKLINETMEEMGISRITYYRYLRYYRSMSE